MKEKANIKTKIAVVGIIVFTLLIIGIISMPNVIERISLQVGEKEEQDATSSQVLSGKTFTSSAAGVGVAGAMADFTNNLQTATVASNATGVSTINVPAGYYEQIQVDASAVYEAAYNAGRTQGRNDVINNPSTYNLYTKTQYDNAIVQGRNSYTYTGNYYAQAAKTNIGYATVYFTMTINGSNISFSNVTGEVYTSKTHPTIYSADGVTVHLRN